MAYEKLTSKSLAHELGTTTAVVDRALVELGLAVRKGKRYELTDQAKLGGLGEEGQGQYGSFLLWHRKVLPLLAPLCSPPTRAEYNALVALVSELQLRDNELLALVSELQKRANV